MSNASSSRRPANPVLPRLKLQIACAKCAGRDGPSQDAVGYMVGSASSGSAFPEAVFAMADGMGGLARGEEASATAVQTMTDEYQASVLAEAWPDDVPGHIEDWFLRAHRAIAGLQAVSGLSMGSTLLCGVIHGCRCWIAWVGDSRAYLVRQRQAWPLTRDHSVAQELADQGAINIPPEARCQLTRYLGQAGNIPRPDLRVEELQSGDSLVLATDGLYGCVDEKELGQVAATHRPVVATRRLLRLAESRPYDDDMSVLVVRLSSSVLGRWPRRIRGGEMCS